MHRTILPPPTKAKIVGTNEKALMAGDDATVTNFAFDCPGSFMSSRTPIPSDCDERLIREPSRLAAMRPERDGLWPAGSAAGRAANGNYFWRRPQSALVAWPSRAPLRRPERPAPTSRVWVARTYCARVRPSRCGSRTARRCHDNSLKYMDNSAHNDVASSRSEPLSSPCACSLIQRKTEWRNRKIVPLPVLNGDSAKVIEP